MKVPKIVFILDSISQPRCIKRVRSFINNGFEVEIYGFDRGVYNVNAKIDDQEIKILSYANSGKGYVSKLINSYKHIKKILNKQKNTSTLYYVFGYDNALVISLFKNKKYIYEIGDLVYTYFNNSILRNFLLLVDKIIIKRSFLSVLITEGMKDYLYGKNITPSNVLIQRNKIDHSFKEIERKFHLLESDKRINFGFAGAIRYESTVFRVAKIIGLKFPQYSFYFFGDSTNNKNVINLANTYENIYFMGPFRNPQDLESIYNNIDVVVACYETNTVNEKIAEPNKLYEALFFCKPLLVSKNTYLESLVTKENNFGYSIDATNDKEVETFIQNISIADLNKKITNISKLSKESVIDDNGKGIINYLLSNNKKTYT